LKEYQENHLDFILTPGLALPAVKLGTSNKLFFACIYTLVFNSMDLPSGVVPVTLIEENEQ